MQSPKKLVSIVNRLEYYIIQLSHEYRVQSPPVDEKLQCIMLLGIGT